MRNTLASLKGIRIFRIALVGFLVSSLIFWAVGPDAFGATDDERVAEYQIKAAFLYKFSSYVEWPGNPDAGGDSFTIAVIGADVLAEHLTEMVKGRKVQGKPIVVRVLEGREEEDLSGVHVLFIGSSAEDDPASILARVQGEPVLTVTESDSDEGIINFVVVDNKVRFDITLSSAERKNLKISARLLEVARKVVERTS